MCWHPTGATGGLFTLITPDPRLAFKCPVFMIKGGLLYLSQSAASMRSKNCLQEGGELLSVPLKTRFCPIDWRKFVFHLHGRVLAKPLPVAVELEC